jgi:hypothetical protein
VVAEAQLQRWREVVGHLRQGPAPRGELFDLCRRLLDAAPQTAEAAEACRLLLEGAIADAATPVADAQDVVAILKAASSGTVTMARLVGPT